MPTYEDERITLYDLLDLRKKMRCQECGGMLNVFMDSDSGKTFLACNDWHRTHHEGIEREASRYEKEGLASLNINSRREIMEKEYGKETTTALDKARLPMTGALTKPQAMDILKLVYPKAPENEIIRTAIFCRDFGLHPLAREVFLIPFKDTWAMVVGIPANRKMAHNIKGEFSFLDDTPRAASDAEIIKQFGRNSEEAKDNIISVTKLKGEGGNLAIGFGLYLRSESPKGMEKGNTSRNMANIRSERQAMDRLPGKPLPRVEVVDERYIEVPDIGKVIEATGEIIEGEVREVKESPLGSLHGDHWCQEHNCAFTKKRKFGKDFWSHPLPGGGWCNENDKPKKEPAAKNNAVPESEPITVEPEPAPQPMQEPVANTIDALKETMQLCNWGTMEIGKYCNAEKGWKIQEFKDLTPEQIAEAIDYIKKNPK